MSCEGLGDVKQDVSEIKADIKEINGKIGRVEVDIAHHIARTDRAEERIDLLEDFIRNQTEHNNGIMDRFIEQSKAHSAAQAKLIKTTLGVFTAIAVLVGALWKISL